jgi:hypothetical protein
MLIADKTNHDGWCDEVPIRKIKRTLSCPAVHVM